MAQKHGSSKKKLNAVFDFTGTVNLGKRNSSFNKIVAEQYQFLYAGQSYGTFYGVFGKFNVDHRGSKPRVDSASFILVNYKGTVNLGIGDEIFPLIKHIKVPTISEANEMNLLCLDFEIEIIPFAPSFKEKKIDLNECYLNDDVEHLSISVNLVPVTFHHGKHHPWVGDPYFDSERYERSGLYYKERDVININTEIYKLHLMNADPDDPSMIKNDESEQNPKDKVVSKDNNKKAPWGFCPRGINRIVFA